MNKSHRLNMLRERGRLLEEKSALLFGGGQPGASDIQEEIGDMDTFREERKDKGSVKGLNSDER